VASFTTIVTTFSLFASSSVVSLTSPETPAWRGSCDIHRHSGSLLSTLQTLQSRREPHSSAIDLVFYDGTQFPSEYRGSAFVVSQGSWNRSQPTGYKVVRVPFKNGRPLG
jgi:glucose/arabinose dehydrogenase